jgi:hypothetical protein
MAAADRLLMAAGYAIRNRCNKEENSFKALQEYA